MDPPANIADYSVIGNFQTAVLISRFGTIDWACLPRFASSSVFARLLDSERGGFHAIVPVEPASSVQEYIPSTAILRTRFHLDGGRELTVTDFMPVEGELGPASPPMIARIAEPKGGPVKVRVTFAPRFDYGRRAPTWTEGKHGWIARAGGIPLLHRTSTPSAPVDGRIEIERTLGLADSLEVEIIGSETPVHTVSVRHLLRETERFWHGWVHSPSTPLHVLASRWHAWVERSEITLKLLARAETGAFVAAPTTSLPEWPGGARNWDYRFAWIRDAAFTAQSLLLLGHRREARGFLGWAVSRLQESGDGRLRVMYGPHGDEDLTEREIVELSGFLGSRPVRVGNGAADQFQLDIYGELLDAAGLLAERELEFVRPIWSSLAVLAESVERRWLVPDQGIWEMRGPPAHYVHSKLMAWVALDRAAELARKFEGERSAERWVRSAARVREAIETRGWNEGRGAFTQSFGSTALDAANLRMSLVGFLPPKDARILSTADRVAAELGSGAFIYRYHEPDGIAGPEGAFLPCGFWLVEVLARAGRTDEAEERFTGLLASASPTGLFSEEFDPARKMMLGNYPQAFTHIALLRAVLALGLAQAPADLRDTFSWLQRHLG
ncbi:MAG: glycoside hydrolase family 15 protein [Thermoplasmata archaeon]